MTTRNDLGRRDPARRSQVGMTLSGDGFRYPGNYFCDENFVVARKALYPSGRSNLADFSCLLRILPGRYPADPKEWDLWRLNHGRGNVGDWILSYKAWRGAGNPICTFLLHDGTDQNYPMQDNPAHLLGTKIDWAIDNGYSGPSGNWGVLVSGRNGPAAIKRPTTIFLVQCVLASWSKRFYPVFKGLEPGARPFLFDLGWDIGNKILSLVDEPTEGYQGDPNDFDRAYACGDPVGIHGGQFFLVYPESKRPQWFPEQPKKRYAQEDEGRSSGGKALDRYEVHMLPSLTLSDGQVLSPDLSAYEAQLQQTVRPIPEVLKFPNEAEQARILLKHVRYPDNRPAVDALMYAWADHSEWWPEKSSQEWGEYVGREQVQSGYGGDPGYGQPPATMPQAMPQAATPSRGPASALPAPAAAYPGPAVAPAPPAPARVNGNGPAPAPAAASDFRNRVAARAQVAPAPVAPAAPSVPAGPGLPAVGRTAPAPPADLAVPRREIPPATPTSPAPATPVAAQPAAGILAKLKAASAQPRS